jgi:branched-subunit amino acid transport protein AzlD
MLVELSIVIPCFFVKFDPLFASPLQKSPAFPAVFAGRLILKVVSRRVISTFSKSKVSESIHTILIIKDFPIFYRAHTLQFILFLSIKRRTQSYFRLFLYIPGYHKNTLL